MYAAQNACPHAGYGLDVGDIEDYAGCGRAGFDDALRAPAVSCPAHLFAFEVPRRWWSDRADDTVQESDVTPREQQLRVSLSSKPDAPLFFVFELTAGRCLTNEATPAAHVYTAELGDDDDGAAAAAATTPRAPCVVRVAVTPRYTAEEAAALAPVRPRDADWIGTCLVKRGLVRKFGPMGDDDNDDNDGGDGDARE